jgi:UDP-glucuronate 4-epimerase
VEALLTSRCRVVGVDCLADSYDPALKRRNLAAATDWDDFEFHHTDLTTANLRPLIDDCELVFHFAAESGVRTSWGTRFDAYVQNNVLATQRLLEASTERPPKRFVYASSSSVYGQPRRVPTPESEAVRPLSPYGVTKVAAEHLCELYHANFGVPIVVLRFFSVYGPRQRPDAAFHQFCRAALEGRPLTLHGDGRQTRDFTFVADAVSAATSAGRAPAAAGGTYNISGGASVSLRQAIRVLESIAGRPLETERTERKAGDVGLSAADTTRAKTDLGYAPSVSLVEGLRAEFDWAREATAPSRDGS